MKSMCQNISFLEKKPKLFQETRGTIFFSYFPDAYQYSFVGPLSMQKGCDQAFHMYTKTIDSVINNEQKPKKPNNGIGFETNKLSYRGMNYFLYSRIMFKTSLFQVKIHWWLLTLVASCPGLQASTT